MTSQGKFIFVELDVDTLCKGNTPYLNFWIWCIQNGYFEPNENGNGFHTTVDFVYLTPSKSEIRNKIVTETLEKFQVLWDDFR